ncbi:hypothetical protein PVAND_001513 [Polypedilum vanderplanki]|uniref:NACHT domain-containing protein n=1 Tax=Polypedilum vanderplanki TaxID=319348 RepID=A0A9J6BN58_POLVA|nr:hypothetical protein PVAND_001513 [Polypedilum vanderplanki]
MEEPEVQESFISKKTEMKNAYHKQHNVNKRTRQKSHKHTYILLFVILSIFFVIAFLIFIHTKTTKSYSWQTMTNEQKSKAWNGNVKFADVAVKCSDLFNKNDSKVFNSLNSMQIEKLMNGETLNLNEAENKNLEDKIFLIWSNLTENLKKKIAEIEVNFQGQKIMLNQIVGNENEIYEFLNSSQIFQLIKNEKQLAIGDSLEFENDFYIERKFYNRKINLNEEREANYEELTAKYAKTFDDLLKDAEIISDDDDYYEINENEGKFKPVLISDVIGSGKSMTMKHLAVKLKEKFPQKWIVFIDVKKLEVKNFSNFNEAKIKEILIKFLKPFDNKFEAEIFNKQFKTLILLLDGIDESSKFQQKFFKKFLQSLNKEAKKIHLWISSRVDLGEEFEEILDIQGYKLFPFSEFDRKNFVDKIYEAESLNENIAKAANEAYWNMSRKIQDELNSHYKFNPSNELFNSPAMIRLIAEISIPLSNSNDENRPLDVSNIYSIFEHFIARKLKLQIYKDSSMREIAMESIENSDLIKIHQKYALLHTFDDELATPDNLERSSSDLPLRIIGKDYSIVSDKVSNFGILFIDVENETNFSHIIFEEFFTAQFLIENICELQHSTDVIEVESRIRLLLKALQHETRVFNFLVSYFEMPLSKCKENKQFNEILTTTIKKKLKTFIVGGNFLRNLERASIFTNFFTTLKRKLWKIDENETFITWLANFRPHEFIRNFNSIKNISKVHFLNDSDIEKLFKEKTDKIKEFHQFVEFLKEKYQSEWEEIFKELFKRSCGKILRYFVKNVKDFNPIWKEIKNVFKNSDELEEFLLLDGSLLDSVMKNSGKDAELILTVLGKYHEELKNESNLFESLYYQTDEGDAFLKANLDSLTKIEKIFNNYWKLIKSFTTNEQRTQLLLMNVRGQDSANNIFYGALTQSKDSIFDGILTAYDETFDKRMMRYLCINFFGTFEDYIHEFFRISSSTFKRFIEYSKILFIDSETEEFLKVVEYFKEKLDEQKHNKRYKFYIGPLENLIATLKVSKV